MTETRASQTSPDTAGSYEPQQPLTTPSSQPGERRWVWGFAALVMAVTFLPYLIGYGRQGDDWRFTGFVFGVQDGNSYIAKMLSGTSGAWLFRTPYTAYPQPGLILFMPYLLLGKLAAAPGLHEQLTALFGLFRLAAGFMMILASYDFAAVFIADPRWRRWATVLATLGGGLGWLSLVGLSDWFAWIQPLEFYSPEAFGFLSIYGLPHLAAARALLLWGLRDFLLPAEPAISAKAWLRTGVVWIGIWLFQPLILLIGMIVISVFLGVTWIWQLAQRGGPHEDWARWKQYFTRGVRIMAVSFPFALYTFLSIKLEPALRAWEAQNTILSPPPSNYLLGYGILLPLALLGIRPLLREMAWRGIFLAGWLCAAPLLAYAPFSVQRRLLDGVWVVICILAVSWMARLAPRMRKLAFRWSLLAFPTSILLLAAGLMFAWNPSVPLFRPVQEVRAFEYLAREAEPGAVVVAADDTSNALPAWARVQTLIGHGPESINGSEMRERVRCFYSDCSEAQRQSLLDEFAADYIIWGPDERALGSWDPRAAANLQQVYAVDGYWIFKVP